LSILAILIRRYDRSGEMSRPEVKEK
jgi:hypothetical protein